MNEATKPRTEAFIESVDRQFQRHGRTQNPFTQAQEYVRERQLGLEVFLVDLDAPIDTNHLERTLRATAWAESHGSFV